MKRDMVFLGERAKLFYGIYHAMGILGSGAQDHNGATIDPFFNRAQVYAIRLI